MPPLLAGNRRRLIVLLTLSGIGQAAATVATAVALPALLTATESRTRWVLGGVLLISAAVIGGLRVVERVLSERLGQSYVTELRSDLIKAALGASRGPNLGITIARTTNDLTSVRNWLALGISPLLAAIPLIIAVLGALLWLDVAIGAAVALVLAALGVALLALSRPALNRARNLRKRRGRMAAHIADTVTASASIRSAGGNRRELVHIDKLSQKVAAAAVSRAVISGGMRGIAAAAATVAMVVVAIVGAVAQTSMPAVTTALLLIGVIATPISDLGRISEYRQAYNAARLVITPVLQRAHDEAAVERLTRRSGARRKATSVPAGTVHIADLPGASELLARPGDRVLLIADDDADAEQTIEALLNGSAEAWVQIDGRSLHTQPPSQRRELVGWAARGTAIERGTINRAVRYRVPSGELGPSHALRRVGLSARVSELPDGARTTLRRGGEPLSMPDRARLLIARATYADPPLLILDHIDEQLDSAGREMLAGLVRHYPGVVIARTHQPQVILGEHRAWEISRQRRVPALVPALTTTTGARK